MLQRDVARFQPPSVDDAFEDKGMAHKAIKKPETTSAPNNKNLTVFVFLPATTTQQSSIGMLKHRSLASSILTNILGLFPQLHQCPI